MIADSDRRNIKKVAVVGSESGRGCGGGAEVLKMSNAPSSTLDGARVSVYESPMLGGRPNIKLYNLSAWYR